MVKSLKVPKDLGIVVKSNEEIRWTRVKYTAEEMIKKCGDEIAVQTELLKIAEKKLREEKKKPLNNTKAS